MRSGLLPTDAEIHVQQDRRRAGFIAIKQFQGGEIINMTSTELATATPINMKIATDVSRSGPESEGWK